MSVKIKKLKVSVPGRVCLFGEHQDYLRLPIIACAISKRINVEGSPVSEGAIRIALPDIEHKELFSLNGEIKYTSDRDYFRSTINVLKRKGYTFSHGFDCTVYGDIPINAGTSSSSALVVAWIQFCVMMSDQSEQLKPEEIAHFAYEAEVLEFSEPGGMMDQYSTAIGNVIYLDPYPAVKVGKINPELKTFVLGNSNQPKNTKVILARVKNGVLNMTANLILKYPEFSLQTIEKEEIELYRKDLSDDEFQLLSGTIKNRDICREAKKVLETGPLNHKLIGELLNEHHKVLRDVQQISTPKIDRMIEAALKAGSCGAKINGSGGGGCMFAYAPENPEIIASAIEEAGGTAYIVNPDNGLSIDKTEFVA